LEDLNEYLFRGEKALSKEEWTEIIAEADVNKDGLISFDEFHSLMTKMAKKM